MKNSKPSLESLSASKANRDSWKREAARRSLSEFVRQAWHVLEPNTAFVDGIHVQAVCQHLQAVTEDRIRDLIINIPPGHAKSLLCAVFWPAWVWIDRPHVRWLFGAYSATLSVRDSVKCRRLLESDWYRDRWGDRFRLADDENRRERFSNNKTGHRIATSVGGTATGERADIVVIDDAHSVDQAASDAERTAAVGWFNGTMSSRLNDLRSGHRIVVGHRLHEADLTGDLLTKGGFEHLCLPAEFEPERRCSTSIWTDPRQLPNQLLWPERVTQAELDKMKTLLGSFRYAGQFQQRPAPQAGGLVRREWFRHYDRPPDDLTDYMFSVDAAFKGGATNDYVVCQVWARRGADMFLLDQARQKLDFPGTLRMIRAMAQRWPQAYRKVVEEKANGAALIASLRNEIPGLVAYVPKESKESRLSAVSAMIESGNCYLPRASNAPWVDTLVEEIVTFPNARHDDQTDCLSQALGALANLIPAAAPRTWFTPDLLGRACDPPLSGEQLLTWISTGKLPENEHQPRKELKHETANNNTLSRA
jgi:predicted phage terminase large subunit-like protein